MIKPRNLITEADIAAVAKFMLQGNPLSGFLAGNERGGQAVQRLEEMWATKWGRRHAIAVNSATSGLLAACHAINIGGQDTVAVPALSMSATAAVPLYCGAELAFMDVDEHGCATFGTLEGQTEPDAAIVTTLFGYPVDRRWLQWQGKLIIDNAQGVGSGYAEDRALWSEQMATIVVTSFNVHKQINCGELGIITTNDDDLAHRMRMFINHGETSRHHEVGLNFRPNEIAAILALQQIARLDETLSNFSFLAARISDNMPQSFKPLPEADNILHGRYCYAFAVPPEKQTLIAAYLNQNGVPAMTMMRPLYELPAFERFKQPCPVAERMADYLVVFEPTLWCYEQDIILISQVLDRAAKL